MNAALRERHLRALGVEPLRLRPAVAAAVVAVVPSVPAAAPAAVAATPVAVAPAASVAPAAQGRRKLALHPDSAEMDDPAIRAMYTALTEAVGKAGLQHVRVCDVAEHADALVMVFGNANLPPGVPAVRVLRVDPLSVLFADRERKRLLWEQMLALGRGAGG